MALEYGVGASIIMDTASRLAGFYRKTVVTPELVLLALAQDDAFRALYPSAREFDERLETTILASATEAATTGWSPRATRALHTAWDRAYGRARSVHSTPKGGVAGLVARALDHAFEGATPASAFVTRGDLLSGIAGAGGEAASLLTHAVLPCAELDAEDVLSAETPANHARLFNDAATTMDFVLTVLREVFACTQPRAMYLMHRTHFCESSVVGPFVDIDARIERARAMAKDASFPFRIEGAA